MTPAQAPASSPFLAHVRDDRVERQRFLTLKETLAPFSDLIRGQRVLDFGASYGLSACVLLELGAGEVTGVEPDAARVERGREILRSIGYDSRATLHHTGDTTRLPLADASVDVVIANAVLEHIPGQRGPYVRELWRVLAPGGHLVVNETPNKYLPIDLHTTGGLWFVPWLPSELARRYAIWRGRFSPDEEWATSGWRGVGFYEIAAELTPPYEVLPERTRLRHRILSGLGLPANLLDPYPVWLFRKL